MKKVIFFSIAFLIILTISSFFLSSRVDVIIETNSPTKIELGKSYLSFEVIKNVTEKKVAFWNRFFVFDNGLDLIIPPHSTIEIMEVIVAEKRYTVSELQEAMKASSAINDIGISTGQKSLIVQTGENALFLGTNIALFSPVQRMMPFIVFFSGIVLMFCVYCVGLRLLPLHTQKKPRNGFVQQTLSCIEQLSATQFILIATLLLFLTFGYLTFFPPLNTDNMLICYPHGDSKLTIAWLSQDRLYGVILIPLLPLFDTIPVFLSFFGAVFLYFTAFAYVKIFKCTPVQKLCIYFVFLTFPTWTYVWTYFFLSPQTTIFTMLAVISFYYFTRKNDGLSLPKRDYLISLIFFFFACWGFETTPTIFLVLFATWLLVFQFNQLKWRELIKQTFLALSIAVFSCLGTMILAKTCRICLGISKSEYLKESYSQFTDGVTILSYITALCRGFLNIFEMFPWDWFGLIWFVLIPLTFWVVIYKSKREKVLMNFFILIGMIVSPFLLTFLVGAPTPCRACIAYPFMVIGLVIILLKHVKTQWIVLGIVCLSAFIMFKSTFYINKRTFYENKFSNLQEFHFNRILNIIYDHNACSLPIVFVGGIKDTVESTPAVSFGSLISGRSAGGQLYGPYYLMFNRVLGHHITNIPTDEMFEHAKNITKDWSSYPDKSCAKIVDSVLVIKLSEPMSEEVIYTHFQ